MSDNVPLYAQRTCTVCADGELYNLDVFSYVQPPVFGTEGSLNQLIMYVTRAIEDSGRVAFIQEQKTQGMMEVYSNIFPWKKTQGGTLITELAMGDMSCRKEIERRKIDEMKLGENALITLPNCITSSMKCDKLTLMNENMEKLLELRELNVRLSMPQGETRAAVEHEYCSTRQPTEQDVVS